jgi:hypothetical protein
MKLNAVLLSTLLFAPFPAHSQQYNVRDECYRNVEQYIPGYTSPDGRYFRGRVRTTRESIPCGGGYYHASQPSNQQPVRCGRNQSIFGGLLGGGIAALVSKKDSYLWSIPLGLVSGVAVARADC